MRFWNIASIENSWIYPYYVITNFRLEKSLSIGLSKMLLDQIQLSEEEAFELAYKNSCTKGMLQEAEVFRTMAMLRKKVDSDFPIPRVHLAYSLQKEYGANIMLNQGFLKMTSDRLGGNYYVMPISRWKVMLISGAIDQTTEERIRLNKIMKDVTVMGYDSEVIVSDHAYFYKTHRRKKTSNIRNAF